VRKLTLYAPSLRSASNWFEAFNSFYKTSFRRNFHPLMSTFPTRPSSSVRLYVCGKEYFMALCVALLQAKEEIFIASWMVSPTQLLTRPPLPPLRLDQVLKYKAEQGVRIYVLLYKEVEMSGTGNDSLKSKLYLESLSPNVHVIRHPNKLLGSSTAILWSHHEKLVIVDRNLAFAGGIDPCFGRWDDATHSLTDEEGTLFPGTDYYQPARGLFRPVFFPPAPTSGSVSGGPQVGDRVLIEEELNNEAENIVDEVCSDEEEGLQERRSSDVSDDAPSVASSLSCQSFLEDNLSLFRTRAHGDSLGTLTEEEAHAIRSQGRYETSPNELLVREGHLAPLVPMPVSSAPQLGQLVNPVQSPTGLVPRSSGQLQSVPPSHSHSHSHSQIIVQSVAVSKNVQTATTSLHASSQAVIVQSTPVSQNNLQNVHQPYQQQQQQQQHHHQQQQHYQPREQRAIQAQVLSISPPPSQPQQGQIVNQQQLQGNSKQQSTAQFPQMAQPSLSRSNIPSTGSSESIYSSSTSVTSSRSLYSINSTSMSSSFNSPSSTIPDSDDAGTVSDKISSWLKGISEAFEDKNMKIPNSQLREQYPRMPWHDVHSSMAGLPARDLGAHFVMRWNHHKKSKGTQELRYLTDVSDVTHFGVCAKCTLEKIFETVEKCPRCGHNLGPVKRSLNITKDIDLMSPSTLELDINNSSTETPGMPNPLEVPEVSYITFRCQFKAKLGCRIQGDGPVLVTQITDGAVVRELPSSLLKREGEAFKTEILCEQGLYPMIGDVVTSVNGSSVLHLTTEQLQRFLHRSKQKKESLQLSSRVAASTLERDGPSFVKRRNSVSSSADSVRSRRNSKSAAPQYALTVCFRRYYVDDVHDVVKGDTYYKMMTLSMLTLKVSRSCIYYHVLSL
jgi:hypothetical protein